MKNTPYGRAPMDTSKREMFSKFCVKIIRLDNPHLSSFNQREIKKKKKKHDYADCIELSSFWFLVIVAH